ncbi:MAG: hypothetical protein HY308_16215 [Gammaproteobacteria bacterium]|nr:hypothetical protein [Gammaproteobacteria bacterium]
MKRQYWLGVIYYLVGTFVIAFLWHLVIFSDNYEQLHTLRDDPIIPLGMLSMAIQGLVFSWLYPRVAGSAAKAGTWLAPGLMFGAVMGLLSWSFTTVADAAKHPMTSVADFVLLETGFTVVVWLVVGPLMALAHRRR